MEVPEDAAIEKIETVEATAHLVDTSRKAWLNVVGGFFALFNSWGVVNTFGVFQTIYQQDILPQYSASTIAWIGSFQSAFILFMGIVVGPLFDRGYFRYIISVGFVFTCLGVFMTSLASTYWQIFLAQSLCLGIGVGCTFVSSVSCVATWFREKKALAQGITAAGSSMGSVIYPIMVNSLYPQIGFGWTVRAFGLVVLLTYLITLFLMRPRYRIKKKTSFHDLAAFKERRYLLFCLGLFSGFWALYTVYYFVQDFATVHNVDPNVSIYLLAILNAASTAGRILPNMVADRLGPPNVMATAMLLTGGLIYVWLAATSTAGLIVFCLAFGFTSGGFVSLPPPSLVSLTPDPSKIGRRLGQGFAFCSLALLTGAPTGGALLQYGGYTAAACWSGSMVIFGGLLIIASRLDGPAVHRIWQKLKRSDKSNEAQPEPQSDASLENGEEKNNTA